MKVLSLFDGLSGGRIALKVAGVECEKYYRSEIDKHANIVAKANYPKDIDLGDVTKWREWNIGGIDLLIAGSPCQGFSYAGKQLNFKDSRSALFFEFVNILNHYKPKYFMLENVKMKKEYQDIISKILGCEPEKINSKLFSAQSRERLYWTNIPVSSLPESNREVIADIIGVDIVNERQEKIIMSKSDFKVKVRKNYIDTKELCSYLRRSKELSLKTISEISRNCNVSKTKAEHWFRLDSSFSIPCVESWGKLKECLNLCNKYDKSITEFEVKNNNFDMAKRIYHTDGKHPTLTTLTGGGQRKTITDGRDMFYLNPTHCEKLQTVPLNYTNHVSDRQRFRMLGNGWTIKVVAHIFKGLK
jgi:DNA (cytosine-5)-methyltransferase 3A